MKRQIKPRNRFHLGLVILLVFVLVPELTFAQTGGGSAIAGQLRQFIKDYWLPVQVICYGAALFCLAKVVIALFMKGEGGGATNFVYFLLGAIILGITPFIMNSMFGLQL